MKIMTYRFGEIEVDESGVLCAQEGLPGFEELKRYTLLNDDDSYPVLWLQSLDDGDIALPVMDTFFVLPGQSFDIEDAELESLQMDGGDTPMILSILVIPEDVTVMTANLAAPVLINAKKGLMKQVILNVKDAQVRRPVYRDILKAIEGGAAVAGTDAQG